MADDPWAAFRTPASDDPWAQFRTASPAQPEAEQPKKQFGLGDTWPAQIAKSMWSAATLPGQVYQNAQNAPPTTISDSDVSPLGVGRALDLAGIAGPINPMARAGDQTIPGIGMALRKADVPIPTATELKASGGNYFNAARDTGLEITGSALGDKSQQIQQYLFGRGIHPVDAPSTYTKLKELENAPEGSFVTAANLISLRKSLGRTAQNFNPTAKEDQLAASLAIQHLDQLLPSIAEKDVLAGSPAATEALLSRGRGDYGAALRSNDISGELDKAYTGILERAQNRAQAANSGRNIDNTIRQKVEGVLEKPKEVSGLTDAEVNALFDVVMGSKTRNFARAVGNKLGGGGGLGQTALSVTLGGAGALAGGGIPGAIAGAAIPPVIGSASRSVANMLAKKSLNSVDELIRMRSPLYQEALQNAPMTQDSIFKRMAILRALAAGGGGYNQQ